MDYLKEAMLNDGIIEKLKEKKKFCKDCVHSNQKLRCAIERRNRAANINIKRFSDLTPPEPTCHHESCFETKTTKHPFLGNLTETTRVQDWDTLNQNFNCEHYEEGKRIPEA